MLLCNIRIKPILNWYTQSPKTEYNQGLVNVSITILSNTHETLPKEIYLF